MCVTVCDRQTERKDSKGNQKYIFHYRNNVFTMYSLYYKNMKVTRRRVLMFYILYRLDFIIILILISSFIFISFLWLFIFHILINFRHRCYDIVSEFEFQSHYYVHFQTNTLGKGMNPTYFPSYRLNIIISILTQLQV